VMQSKSTFFSDQKAEVGDHEAILFDPSRLKAFVMNNRRTSSSVEKAPSKSDSNSEREEGSRCNHSLPKSKTYAQLHCARGYAELNNWDLDAIEEEGPKLEEFEKLADEELNERLEACRTKFNQRYGGGAFKKEMGYWNQVATKSGHKKSNSTLDTMKGKAFVNHNRNGSWVVSQGERDEIINSAQGYKPKKQRKSKPITTPNRFYHEPELPFMSYSDKNFKHKMKNRLSHNNSFSERVNISENGSYGKLRKSQGKIHSKVGYSNKASFVESSNSDLIGDYPSDKKLTQRLEEKSSSFIGSAEKQQGSKRRFHPVDKSVDYKVDPEKAATNEKTTLMIRNIPNKYTQEMMLELINENYKDSYDFFYLPIDLKNKCNLGYAFINFLSPEYIVSFFKEFEGARWGQCVVSQKVCSIRYARLQGREALESHFNSSKVMCQADKKLKPLLLNIDFSRIEMLAQKKFKAKEDSKK